jgi:hypothetical protein
MVTRRDLTNSENTEDSMNQKPNSGESEAEQKFYDATVRTQ